MVLSKKGIYIISAKRTPFCKYGGPLRELPASHAFAIAAKAAMEEANVNPELIDQTIIGNVNYLSQCDGGKTPRYCGLFSGVPIERPALGVNRGCGSGIQAIITATMDILYCSSKICLTGGTEIFSSLPLLVRNVRFGTSLGTPYKLEDHIQRQFLDSYSGKTKPKLAEDLAKRYKLSRTEIDQFAKESYFRWKTAQEMKIFEKEIKSLTVTLKKKDILVNADFPSDLENLENEHAILEDGNLITMGNSSAPADGAAALLLADAESLKAHNLQPLARVSGWACVGVDPLDGGLAAKEAVRRLLDEQKLRVDDVDLFELNETYASDVIINAKELKLDLAKVNVNGGACVLGHPVAATGARMVAHLTHELGRCNKKKAVAASSCGAGQGLAIMLERI